MPVGSGDRRRAPSVKVSVPVFKSQQVCLGHEVRVKNQKVLPGTGLQAGRQGGAIWPKGRSQLGRKGLSLDHRLNASDRLPKIGT